VVTSIVCIYIYICNVAGLSVHIDNNKDNKRSAAQTRHWNRFTRDSFSRHRTIPSSVWWGWVTLHSSLYYSLKGNGIIKSFIRIF